MVKFSLFEYRRVFVMLLSVQSTSSEESDQTGVAAHFIVNILFSRLPTVF